MSQKSAIFRKYIRIVLFLCMASSILFWTACKNPGNPQKPVEIPTEPADFIKAAGSLLEREQLEILREYDGAEAYVKLVDEMEEKGLKAIVYDANGKRYEQFIDADLMTLSTDASTLMQGAGSGIYVLENGSSYIFSGEYKDGKRSGHGKMFWKISNGYEWSAGEWAEDAPNGAGTCSHYGPYYIKQVYFTRTVRGTLVNGLWDGTVQVKIETVENHRTYDLQFEAANGVPLQNRYDQLKETFPNESCDPNLIYYAFATTYQNEKHQTISAENYDDAWVLSIPTSERLGTLGYGE